MGEGLCFSRQDRLRTWFPVLARKVGPTFSSGRGKALRLPASLQSSATMDAPRGLRLRWLGPQASRSAMMTPRSSSIHLCRGLCFSGVSASAGHRRRSRRQIRHRSDGASGSFNKLKAILVSHTHHRSRSGRPLHPERFPKAANRPLVAGDKNLACLLKAYTGPREGSIDWIRGIDPLKSGPQKIFDFNKKKKLNPPAKQEAGDPGRDVRQIYRSRPSSPNTDSTMTSRSPLKGAYQR